jgi:uncharacterized protein YjdB
MTGSVAVTQAPVIIAQQNIICSGTTTIFTGEPAGGQWSSSKPQVATVDPSTGLITGVIAGTASGVANITYTLNGGSATKAVKVNPSPQLLPGTPVTLAPGQKTELKSNIPNGTWASSAPNIATVVQVSANIGGVTALKTPGTAIITYTLKTGCIAQVTVTVRKG